MSGFDFIAEMRDDVVRAHALRLGVLAVVSASSGKEETRCSVVQDGGLLRLIVNVSGRADGDNGLTMITAQSRPGMREILNGLALAAASFAGKPQTERVPSPCLN